jgi:hypothetical protein
MIGVLAMNNCTCCSNVLLRHIRGNEVYWFCRNCWQTMPVFSEEKQYFASKTASFEFQGKPHCKPKNMNILSTVKQ